MFSEVEQLVSEAIQICLSVLLATSVNFSPPFTTRLTHNLIHGNPLNLTDKKRVTPVLEGCHIVCFAV